MQQAQQVRALEDLIQLLRVALENARGRLSAIKTYQDYMFTACSRAAGTSVDQWEILKDLALDLDYYEPDPRLRAESPAFYGDDHLEEEINEVLRKLSVAKHN